MTSIRPLRRGRILTADPDKYLTGIQWLGIGSWAFFCVALFVTLLLHPGRDAVDRGTGLQADHTLQRAIVSVPQLPIQAPALERPGDHDEASGASAWTRRMNAVVASTGMLARLEAAGGGYPDHDIRRSSDNHSRILSEAGGPEEACQRQTNLPAVFDQRRARHNTVLRRDPDYGRRRSGISTCWYIADKLVQNPDLRGGYCNLLE